MARIQDREKAIQLRKQGKSYSEIKEVLGISKSTLSTWLQEYPLSKKDIVRLRDKNPARIEKFRETMARKRDVRLDTVLQTAAEDIGTLSKRDIYIAGLFLYWAEGTKRARYTTAFANTDPSMICFFLLWLKGMKVPQEKILIRLQLYQDMDVVAEQKWWQKKLDLPAVHFRPPYTKKVNRAELTYKGGHGHGTCNVLVHGRDLQEYISMSLTHFRMLYGKS